MPPRARSAALGPPTCSRRRCGAMPGRSGSLGFLGPPVRLHQVHPAELRGHRHPGPGDLRRCRSRSPPSAQAIVVIAGGIDLSIGSMMALTSVVAASRCGARARSAASSSSSACCSSASCSGAVNGALVVAHARPRHRRHARDVVRLGRLRAPRPGGARAASAADWLKDLATGSFVSEWIPKPAVVLVVIVAVIWIPLRRVPARPVDLRRRQQPAGRLPERRVRRPHQGPRLRPRRPVRGARRPGAHRRAPASARRCPAATR